MMKASCMNKSLSNDLQWFQENLNNELLCKQLNNVKMVICDVDGTLTDGTIDYTNESEFSRAFSIVDGLAMVYAQQANLLIGFLSGKAHGSIQIRAKKLNIPDNLCAGGKLEKIETIKEMIKPYALSLSQVLLVGDDYLDAKVKLSAPEILFATLQDAPFYFQQCADLVVARNGGHHAIRLLLDLILYVQKKHFAQELIDRALSNERP